MTSMKLVGNLGKKIEKYLGNSYAKQGAKKNVLRNIIHLSRMAPQMYMNLKTYLKLSLARKKITKLFLVLYCGFIDEGP